MNEYSKIRNTHDRAVILAQLVNADARAMGATVHAKAADDYMLTAANYEQSRAELWKLIGPIEEGEASEA